MRVTVEYFGPARDAAGLAREEVDCDAPCTAQELVMRIARARGGRLASLLLRDDRLSPVVLLAVNDQQVESEPVSLRDGDVVAIIPPVSGGAC
jgi:molybdopterin converting factor small subunit